MKKLVILLKPENFLPGFEKLPFPLEGGGYIFITNPERACDFKDEIDPESLRMYVFSRLDDDARDNFKSGSNAYSILQEIGLRPREYSIFTPWAHNANEAIVAEAALIKMLGCVLPNHPEGKVFWNLATKKQNKIFQKQLVKSA